MPRLNTNQPLFINDTQIALSVSQDVQPTLPSKTETLVRKLFIQDKKTGRMQGSKKGLGRAI